MRISTQGRPCLGAPLGSEEFVKQFVVKDWCDQLLVLANIAITQLHAMYTAFVCGFEHKLTFLARTTPNIASLLQPMEETIHSRLLPSWTGMAPPNAAERELYALPARLGGLGIPNHVSRSSSDYSDSVWLLSPLSKLILQQTPDYPGEALNAQLSAKQTIHREREATARSAADAIKAAGCASLCHAMTLAQEKGSSTWLTSLPLEEFGLALHKGAFIMVGSPPIYPPIVPVELTSQLSIPSPVQRVGSLPSHTMK